MGEGGRIMKDYRSQMITELRNAIENGTLTCPEICRRLTNAISKELSKTNEAADLGFIKSCQNLLSELYGNEIEPSDELIRSSLESARKKVCLRSRRSTRLF